MAASGTVKAVVRKERVWGEQIKFWFIAVSQVEQLSIFPGTWESYLDDWVDIYPRWKSTPKRSNRDTTATISILDVLSRAMCTRFYRYWMISELFHLTRTFSNFATCENMDKIIYVDKKLSSYNHRNYLPDEWGELPMKQYKHWIGCVFKFLTWNVSCKIDKLERMQFLHH